MHVFPTADHALRLQVQYRFFRRIRLDDTCVLSRRLILDDVAGIDRFSGNGAKPTNAMLTRCQGVFTWQVALRADTC